MTAIHRASQNDYTSQPSRSQTEPSARSWSIRGIVAVTAGVLVVAATAGGAGVALSLVGSYGHLYGMLLATGGVLLFASSALALWRYVIAPLRLNAAWAVKLDTPSTPEASAGVTELADVADAVATLWQTAASADDTNRQLHEKLEEQTDRFEYVLRQERQSVETLSQIARTIREQTDAILEAMEEGIIVVDSENTIVVMNDAAVQILAAETSWIGSDILQCPHVFEELPGYLESSADDDRTWQANLIADGKVVVVFSKPIASTVAQARLIMLRDITIQAQMEVELVNRNRELSEAQEELERRNEDLRTANDRLEELSVTDALTGLPNTRKMHEVLTTAVNRHTRKRESIGFLMLDIDHFKEYNDTYGHPAGDETLKQVATIMQQSIRALDTPARYGGEEFAVILPDCTRDDAVKVAERVRTEIAAHRFAHRKVTVSIGVATMPGNAADEHTLISCADQALYTAKRDGRNRVILWPAETDTGSGKAA